MEQNRHEPIRVMALHALAYCERLFYLEEVEEIRVADDRVYAGRALHEDLRQAEEDADGWTSMELSSEALGLVGKVDAMRRRDGMLIPYEHKRGRCRREGKKPAAWLSDALQVCAYGMLLEEETGRRVDEGRIRYHGDNVTVRVPVDEDARRGVRAAIDRSRNLRSSTERPPVADNDRLCIHCSLSPVCLPEEARLASDPGWEPIRLFPPDRELKTVHVVVPGSHVSRSAETLKIVPRDGDPVAFPMREVGSVVLHGFCQISAQALHSCASNGITVHWLSTGGRYVCGLTGAGGVQRRIRQYRALSDPDKCLELARVLALAKVESQLRYLLRSSRGEADRATTVGDAVSGIRAALRGIARAGSADEVRGHEGSAGRAYFSALPVLFRPEVPEEMRFERRSRRPPRDRFNGLLGFGYALLYQSVLQSVLAVGLEPALGFFHTPRSSAHPLVLDLMELFRVPLWDMPLIGATNRLHWDPAADFEVTKGRVWLSREGRKKSIRLFERRLDDAWKHPVIGYSMSYSRLIELEVRLLEKEWTGSPGLFAKMRLR